MRTVLSVIRAFLTVCVALLILGVVNYGIIHWNDDTGERFVSVDAPKRSSSGAFTAYAEAGPVQNGVPTLIAVIRDKNNTEVFRDTEPYSTRHGVGFTWLSTRDQLWLLSGDVGHSYVQIGDDGRWHKNDITPETAHEMPPEIEELTGRKRHR